MPGRAATGRCAWIVQSAGYGAVAVPNDRAEAVEFRKDLFADERDDDLNEVGRPTQRQDAQGHVTGRSRFFDDYAMPGMLHMKFARSPHHHARIRSLDTREAAQTPGVVRILTSEDVPKKVHTLLILLDLGPDDEPPLAFDKVRYRGEPIAAVIAESEAVATAAAAKVRVEYEPLPAVFDVEESLAPGAPLVNEYHGRNWYDYDGHDFRKIRFGDVERGFREADHVIEERYQMSPIEHAPTETGGCIAAPDTAGRYVCYTNTQALFFSLETAARILDLPSNRLHFVGGTVGGGFGGKVDSVHEPLALLGAMLTQRPVRSAYGRAEEMQVSSPRGAERFYVKDGVMNDGRIVARYARIYFDAGAYSRLSPYGAVKAAAHMPGPYYVPNVWVDARCVYTNRTPSSAMRGFGVTGADFALEVQMDKLARLVGMDPMEFRILNAYRDGDMKAHRRVTKNAALIECVQVAAELADWPLSERYRAMSSTRDGGGERGMIPPEPVSSGHETPPGRAPPAGAAAQSPEMAAGRAAPQGAWPAGTKARPPGAGPERSGVGTTAGKPSSPATPARSPFTGGGRLSSLLGTRRR